MIYPEKKIKPTVADKKPIEISNSTLTPELTKAAQIVPKVQVETQAIRIINHDIDISMNIINLILWAVVMWISF